ncbi:PP2C family protein-serine/threonine phosphatase [Marivita geojedonensis]|uniref:PP2C family protein-serine/threonine phosphatase n=1 Tax=Marivita geojedonensis TaxID=1123756 RepID=UPI000D402EB6|nr:protein phosphatase 2C domain-containing protein [Marivita geojedonensis]PRY72132.1 protein phosphatase [Marivita geojedonensis]
MNYRDGFRFDTATVLDKGCRQQQEDAIASEFCSDSGIGFVVLADGMGGHTSGEIASEIVVSEVFHKIKANSDFANLIENSVGDVLVNAAMFANASVSEYIHFRPETQGMGSTLLSPVIVKGKLFWLSIGDSPLYLFRRGRLFLLNEIHNLKHQMARLVEKGLIHDDDTEMENGNCLTSAIIGRDVAKVDVCDTPVQLMDQDIIIAASDGLQFLNDDQISQILLQNQAKEASAIGQELLTGIKDLDDPYQDNFAVCVIKLELNSCEQDRADWPGEDVTMCENRWKQRESTRPVF